MSSVPPVVRLMVCAVAKTVVSKVMLPASSFDAAASAIAQAAHTAARGAAACAVVRVRCSVHHERRRRHQLRRSGRNRSFRIGKNGRIYS